MIRTISNLPVIRHIVVLIALLVGDQPAAELVIEKLEEKEDGQNNP